ncbi:MAG: hypothetical protein COT91_01575 [Candidatus Doudnabacteria bacterium CG10_big_fil_rev_8_21_14_0_10_41_10]|uniref:Uncharacterized protein n=1 Tax=Candidatus Doudnabacteria bacterium CG10_big_fil_rev_8_21_14_0_10_41_10 TaxID=1974551 RepID=A0A2H0VE73_9BACT|nr:MAG: hypothetical protein COT91_01575 [Candidatus Doudnabacteria bacterium CG10_big_fil_rev_8_21_14_0_10_41_10]
MRKLQSDVFQLPPLILPSSQPLYPETITKIQELSAKPNDGYLEIQEMVPEGLQLVSFTSRLNGLIALQDFWALGDAVMNWIGQCEDTLTTDGAWIEIFPSDFWPFPSRAVFVELLKAKRLPSPNVNLPCAIGARLIFDQLPPVECYTEEFMSALLKPALFLTYEAWITSRQGDRPKNQLDPDRFEIEVVHAHQMPPE